MRLLLAALIAAAVVTGGAVLFSSWFGSVELRTEGDGEVARKRRPDTETETSYPSCEGGDFHCEEPNRFQWPQIGCDSDGIPNYRPPEVQARTSPSWPTDQPDDLPIHHVVMNFCVKIDGGTTDVTARGAPSQVFDQASIHAVERWRFIPATSKFTPIDVCGCEVELTFEPDD